MNKSYGMREVRKIINADILAFPERSYNSTCFHNYCLSPRISIVQGCVPRRFQEAVTIVLSRHLDWILKHLASRVLQGGSEAPCRFSPGCVSGISAMAVFVYVHFNGEQNPAVEEPSISRD